MGWINSKSLSKQIYNIISKMKIGEITKPVKKQNGILFLKLDDRRDLKNKEINVVEAKKKLIAQKKNELFNLYSKSHFSKIKNKSLIEYK